MNILTPTIIVATFVDSLTPFINKTVNIKTIEIAGRFQSREYVKVLDEETKETRIAYELSVAKIRYIEDVNDSEDGDADE